MWSTDLHLARVCAAATDGRTSNVRYIQSQLGALHGKLLNMREDIIEAIISNPRLTESEARVEFSLAIASTRHQHDAIDFDEALRDEYKIARRLNNTKRRVGYGVVIIKPTTHTRFYSIIIAVSAAIAAGNTFIVECKDEVLDRLLCVLFQCLDWELYGLVQGPVTNQDILSKALVVDQTGDSNHPRSINSFEDLPSIAVIDRTANVTKAAKDILSAHFAFSGLSPHAPHLIIVNEWIKDRFIEAVSREKASTQKHGDWSQLDLIECKKAMAEAQTNQDSTIIKTDSLYLVDLHERGSQLATQGGNGRCLVLLTVASLSDAVSVANQPGYLTGYYFADPEAGKFLSQHINSHWTFINHIPLEILVGPAVPIDHASSSPALRYTTKMLSRPRPEIILPIQTFPLQLTELNTPSSEKLQLLQEQDSKALRKTDQGPGTAIGFFEQGIMVGGIFIVLPVLSLLGYCGWTLGCKVLQNLVVI